MIRRLVAILFTLFMSVVTLLSWLYPDPLNTGFFAFSYHKLILFSIGFLVTLLAVSLWFVLSHAGVALFYKLFALFLMAGGVVISAIAGHQLGAPSYYMDGVKLIRPSSPISYATVVEQAGVIFEVSECIASGSVIGCTFTILSTSEDREIYFGRSSQLNDERGNTFKVHNYKFGDQDIGSYARKLVVADVKVNMEIEFTNVPEDSNYVSLIEIEARYANLQNRIKFRKVPIKRFKVDKNGSSSVIEG